MVNLSNELPILFQCTTKLMKIYLLLFIQIIFISSAWGQCSLKLRVNESPPFYFLAENEYKGLFVEQAKSLVNEVDCQIDTIKAPWARSLRMLEQGQIDMMADMSITNERKKFLRFLGPHHHEQIVLVVSENSNFEIQSHTDLLNLPGFIGVEREAYYGPEFEKLLKHPDAKNKWVWFTGEDQYSLDERVRLGRLSGFLDVAKPQYNTKGLKYHPFVINSSPVFFGFSKKSVDLELFEKLQAAFDKVGSRNFENLSRKYN